MEEADRFLVELGEVLKLDEINSAFAHLYFSDTAWRYSKFLGHIALCQLGVCPGILKPPPKASILRAMKGLLCHRLSLSEKRAYLCILVASKIEAELNIALGGLE